MMSIPYTVDTYSGKFFCYKNGFPIGLMSRDVGESTRKWRYSLRLNPFISFLLGPFIQVDHHLSSIAARQM